MITFELQESTVLVKIDTGNGFNITTRHECGNNLYAKLLWKQLRDNQWAVTESFARKNYDEGFDDKQKRKIKRTWHPSKI